MKDTYSNSDLLSKEEIKRILGDERDCDCCDNVIFFEELKNISIPIKDEWTVKNG